MREDGWKVWSVSGGRGEEQCDKLLHKKFIAVVIQIDKSGEVEWREQEKVMCGDVVDRQALSSIFG